MKVSTQITEGQKNRQIKRTIKEEKEKILPMRKRLRFLSRESSILIVVFDNIYIGKGNYTPVKLLSKALCTWKRKSFFELIALSVDSGGGILSCF